MIGKAKAWASTGLCPENSPETWIVDVLLPTLFTLILLGCLIHLGYCALKSQLEPAVSFHYAISAFAI